MVAMAIRRKTVGDGPFRILQLKGTGARID